MTERESGREANRLGFSKTRWQRFNHSLINSLVSDTSDSRSEDDRKKRPRTAFTASQIKSLEAEFERNKYLSVAKRCQLSKSLKLTETQVTYIYLA